MVPTPLRRDPTERGTLIATDFVVERRKTFYGAMEMILRDAAGNVIIFAELTS